MVVWLFAVRQDRQRGHFGASPTSLSGPEVPHRSPWISIYALPEENSRVPHCRGRLAKVKARAATSAVQDLVRRPPVPPYSSIGCGPPIPTVAPKQI